MQLSPRISDILILLFLGATLWYRFDLQSRLGDHYMISIFLGLLPLVLIFVLIKWKVLNPSFFGLINRNKS